MLNNTVSATLRQPHRIQALIRALENQVAITPETAVECVQAANIQAADLQFWADFEHPIADSYGRHLVHDGGDFEIMVMSWSPGDFSAIHDHGSAQWGAVQSFGDAEHAVFAMDNMQLSTVSIDPFPPRTINAVDHDLIHQMGNPSDRPFLSLHVYGSAKHDGAITGDARIFDLHQKCIQYTDGGVFFGLPDPQITKTVSGLCGDRATTLRHHRQMLHRIQQRLMGGEDTIDLWHTAAALRHQITELEVMIHA